MKKIKLEFYLKGVDIQKTPDIVISLKTASPKKFDETDNEVRNHLREFADRAETQFKIFIKELKKETKKIK